MQVKNGTLFVNGQAQVEPFINEKPSYVLKKLTVPPGDVSDEDTPTPPQSLPLPFPFPSLGIPLSALAPSSRSFGGQERERACA